MNEDSYYKVHKYDLKEMSNLGLTKNLINSWLDVMNEKKVNYIFVSITYYGAHSVMWGYNLYNDTGYKWYNDRGYIYLGDFKSSRVLRKLKLEKLKNV